MKRNITVQYIARSTKQIETKTVERIQEWREKGIHVGKD